VARPGAVCIRDECRREDGPTLVITRLALATAICTAGLGLGTSATGVTAQAVTGSVVEVGDGSPVADARLVLRDAEGAVRAAAISGGDGRFRLDLGAPGLVRLEVSHIAYAPWETAEFAVERDETLEVEIRLGIEALPLEALSVVATRSSRGRLSGFDQRRNSLAGFGGYFLTDAEIERRPIATTTSLVWTTPGMSVARHEGGGVSQNVIMAGNCVARTFIDGIRVTQTAGGSLDDLVVPELLAGVEIYPRGLSAPAQYQDTRDPSCGVVLFWTKEPRAGIVGDWGLVRVATGFGFVAGLLYMIVFGR
jgi:hypothetical protein